MYYRQVSFLASKLLLQLKLCPQTLEFFPSILILLIIPLRSPFADCSTPHFLYRYFISIVLVGPALQYLTLPPSLISLSIFIFIQLLGRIITLEAHQY